MPIRVGTNGRTTDLAARFEPQEYLFILVNLSIKPKFSKRNSRIDAHSTGTDVMKCGKRFLQSHNTFDE